MILVEEYRHNNHSPFMGVGGPNRRVGQTPSLTSFSGGVFLTHTHNEKVEKFEKLLLE